MTIANSSAGEETLGSGNTTKKCHLDDEEFRHLFFIMGMISFLTVAIVGGIGNFFFLTLVRKNKIVQNATNILFASLASNDFLIVTVFCPLLGYSLASFEWPFGETFYRIATYMLCVLTSMSIETLVLLTVDRYLAAITPFTAKTYRTARNAKLAICAMWILFCKFLL